MNTTLDLELEFLNITLLSFLFWKVLTLWSFLLLELKKSGQRVARKLFQKGISFKESQIKQSLSQVNNLQK